MGNIDSKVINCILENIEDGKERRIWEIIIKKIIEIDQSELLRKALENEIKFLKNKLKDPFSPYVIKIDVKDLRDYGDINDIASPLGFLRVTLPFKQDDPDILKIYAPCALSALEINRCWGPEVAALYSANINPDEDVKELYEAAKERNAHINSNIWYKMRRLIFQFKNKFAPFYSISNSQHFYQIGIYFYQDEYTKYIGSRSPGILLPHEYYGEDLYYPGITREISPLSIGNQKSGFQKLIEKLRQKIYKREKIENPLRPFYFDEGIGSSKGDVRYIIFEQDAKKHLNNFIKSLDQNKQEAYLNDIALLLYKWIRQNNIQLILLNINSEESVLNKFTLLSSSYLYISDRDKNRRKISRGKVFNICLINSILSAALPAITLITHFKEIIEFLIGTGLSYTLLTSIDILINKEIKKVEEELKEQGKKLLSLPFFEEEISLRSIRNWIESWL